MKNLSATFAFLALGTQAFAGGGSVDLYQSTVTQIECVSASGTVELSNSDDIEVVKADGSIALVKLHYGQGGDSAKDAYIFTTIINPGNFASTVVAGLESNESIFDIAWSTSPLEDYEIANINVLKSIFPKGEVKATWSKGLKVPLSISAKGLCADEAAQVRLRFSNFN